MESRPQFVKMNAQREEDPPQRDVTCADYKICLSLAARRNLCLDCSRCEAAARAGAARAANRRGLPTAAAAWAVRRREGGPDPYPPRNQDLTPISRSAIEARDLSRSAPYGPAAPGTCATRQGAHRPEAGSVMTGMFG